MKTVVITARILQGLIFIIFGLDFFFGFMPEQETTRAGEAFLNALLATGYMFPLIKVTEIVAGVLLLLGLRVPLALMLLAPIIVNIACYHIFLDAHGIYIAAAVVILESFLVWSNRDSFRGLLNARASAAEVVGAASPAKEEEVLC